MHPYAGNVDLWAIYGSGKSGPEQHFLHFIASGALQRANIPLTQQENLPVSIFTLAAAAIRNAQEVPAGPTMQTAFDQAIARKDKDGARAISRLADYFAQQLDHMPASLARFDPEFPLVKRSDLVPGLERNFWKGLKAYVRWRRSARNAIAHATGAVSDKAALRQRDDAWSEFLAVLEVLTKDGGPVHAAEYGAVVSLADRARAQGRGPADLVPEALEALIESAVSPRARAKVIRALKVLEKYAYIKALAVKLPHGLNVDAARRKSENILPDHIEAGIDALVLVASRDAKSWDETTQCYTKTKSAATLEHYRSAMRSYISSTERAGGHTLDRITDFAGLFEPETFYAVIRHWTNKSDEPDGLCARSAYDYCRTIATVLGRNGIEAGHIVRAKKSNPFLAEGGAAGKVMSVKTRRFCEPLVRERAKRRAFLTQHLEYRRQTEDMLATDRPISGDRLTRAREMGTCAAIAAIEIAGAPYRIANTLSLVHRGPRPNLLLPCTTSPFYLITIATGEIKNKKEMPTVKIRSNAMKGRETMDWYLREIRPLFPYGNPLWCASTEDEIDGRVRFGLQKHGLTQSESIFFFPAVTSAQHLSKSVFYEWILASSERIGMPMTPHLYRHGQASILMMRSLANSNAVARLLNINESTVHRHYAWINGEAVIEGAQDEILEEFLV